MALLNLTNAMRWLNRSCCRQLRQCLTSSVYCSIATVACIWYIDFLPLTVFGVSCQCNCSNFLIQCWRCVMSYLYFFRINDPSLIFRSLQKPRFSRRSDVSSVQNPLSSDWLVTCSCKVVRSCKVVPQFVNAKLVQISAISLWFLLVIYL